ncbi:predicted protein [Aspergillus nidulans FGSC A4]|uniref:Uncharacterized protein n=1 Tax=Emericella nidulans (strain FGSC A4 / ATCC 38163 / CBS 112.46 / NRRL 194 / M139) TaxID=227321 RepID=Q5B4Y0_EMENI|nr:hypothetical protein [Aspergillus nidulans FGSC A4]EAA60317.1 predicted protein [Aspergillus nidulans FGSC A4]CBF77604.1 TPA: hypothetical protein ANIA_04400 [Aspergillus nidulans FGSC A4]|eukprot:XP_662004.1 predicted protein [Aspergillus nidulans FGSC A4]
MVARHFRYGNGGTHDQKKMRLKRMYAVYADISIYALKKIPHLCTSRKGEK